MKIINNQLHVCIIDDMLPYQNLFNEIDENRLIPSDKIEQLLHEDISWGDEMYLRGFVTSLIQTEYYKNKRLILDWAINPSICINSIADKNYEPDLIVYDWEYKNFPTSNSVDTIDIDSLSAQLLFDLLSKLHSCFFFVYSSKAQQIPIFLFKKQLDQYANRFQVLLKGERKSILSSEELIYEYIVLKLDNQPSIKVGDENILFNQTGHLENYKDILYLEFILGKESLKKQLNKNNVLSEDVIMDILTEFPFYLYFSNSGLLLSTKNKNIESKFGELQEFTYAEVYKKYGLETIYNVLNNGIIKV